MMKRDEFKRHIPEIEKIIDYTFRDKTLLTQAFTRTSYCNENKIKGHAPLQSNEVLEFFGDIVLSLSIVSYLMSDCTERYEFGIKTELGEGDFSNIKSKLSDKKNLSESTLSLGLEKYLIMGEGDVKLGISKEPSVMEDLFESIIGAIYIDTDKDLSRVMRSVSKMLDISLYKSGMARSGSAKNALQEFLADKKRRMPPPVYKTLSEDGPDHKKVYERGVYVGEELVGRGKGKNLKIADTLAAENALAVLTERERAISEEKASKTAKKVTRPATKAKKAEREASFPSRDVTQGSSAKLLELASRKGTLPPTFRDLGEDGGIHRVECKWADMSAIGEGEERRDARECASYLLIKAIAEKERANKKPAQKSGTVKKVAKNAPRKRKTNNNL